MTRKTPPWVVLEKKRGETPLECLTNWRVANAIGTDTPTSYAGRLDPMAEGKLLVLLGDECKQQAQYTKLDKEYEVELVLDLKTDTGDVLGLSEYRPRVSQTQLGDEEIRKAFMRELGTSSRPYPAYSSKTVNGKPLFVYALEGTLDTITIPEHPETIYDIQLLRGETVTMSQLQGRLENLLAVIPRSDEPSKALGADFRQNEVRSRWKELFSTLSTQESRSFTIIRIRVTCGSGAYMRTLVERIGTTLGGGAVALMIKRTRIGKCLMIPTPFGTIPFWIREYR